MSLWMILLIFNLIHLRKVTIPLLVSIEARVPHINHHQPTFRLPINGKHEGTNHLSMSKEKQMPIYVRMT